VLANFVCDAVAASSPQQLITAANAELTEHVQLLHAFAQARPLTRVVIVPPLPRSTPAWYNVHLPGFLVHLYNEVNGLGSTQVRILSPFAAPPEYFESDGVHLKKDAGVQFISFIIQGVDQVLPVLDCSSQATIPSTSRTLMQSGASQAVQSLNSDMYSRLSGPVQEPPPALPQAEPHLSMPLMSSSLPPVETRPSMPHVLPGSGLDQVGEALNSLSKLHSALNRDVVARKVQDNLIFARIKEDLDFEYNRNRENRFTISGLRPKEAPPSGALERKEFFRGLVSALVSEACPELSPDVVTDVFVNMRYGRGPPFIEGKMDSAASSSAFRIAAAKLVKDETPNFVGLFVANSVTLATRVRIEIMRSIADTLKSATIQAYVQPFASRPVLHLKMKDPLSRVIDGVNRSYTFVESVGRWGHQVSQYSLIPAYRKARPAFIGALEQYFVVLNEVGPPTDVDPISRLINWPSGSNSAPLGPPPRGSWPRLSVPDGRTQVSRPWSRGGRGSRGVVRGQAVKRPHPSLTQESVSTPSKRKNDEERNEDVTENNVDMNDQSPPI